MLAIEAVLHLHALGPRDNKISTCNLTHNFRNVPNPRPKEHSAGDTPSLGTDQIEGHKAPEGRRLEYKVCSIGCT